MDQFKSTNHRSEDTWTVLANDPEWEWPPLAPVTASC